MAWVYLVVAGVCEVVWAAGLKASEGFSRPVVSVVTVGVMVLSFVLLAQAMRTLPLGTAYAVWTGIGAVGAALVGMVAWGEPANAPRVGCILLVVVGIVGLKLSTGTAGR
ncbi:MAG: quaternary ammonium compound efflux SMR transporter SugE [Myxococcota bacterium]